MRPWLFGAVVLSLFGWTGCQRPAASTPAPETPTAAPAAAAATPAPQPIAVPANAAPEQVVTVFLNALRTGDSPTTESLLTGRAREELAKHQMSVDVQSAPNATYQIRAATQLPDNPAGAHVSSIWTEKFEDGDETYEIVWVLRHQPEGWRVAGMAMQLIPDQPAQFLNFENPEDMLAKKDEALAAMQQPVAETAQQPAAQSPAAPARSLDR
jgi:hypothetical protein